MTSIAVFNNKGGVGKTSLVYHLAWMYSELGWNVLAADFDPQANLTSMFLEDDEVGGHAEAVRGCHRAFRDLATEVARHTGLRGVET